MEGSESPPGDAAIVETTAGWLADPQPAQPQLPGEHPFEFHGDSHEYFRIWIVNLALSIVTLGVFSAWAKVRRERYFYGNTWVAGAPFQYLASPLNILKGRAIAVVLLIGYVATGQVMPVAQIGVVAIVLIATPWLMVSALRFRARYSAWSSVNFRFTGSFTDSLKVYLLMYLLLVPTLGLIYPYIRYRQRRFVIDGHRFGGHPLAFGGRGSDFYVIYLTASLVGAGAAVVALLLFVGLPMLIAEMLPPAATNTISAYGVYGGIVATYSAMFVGWCYVASRVTNLGFNSTALVTHGFRSTIRARDLVWLYTTNTLAILLSLGLLVPWAQIRLARYRAQHLAFVGSGDVPAFAAEPGQDRSATGAETASVFDLDLSW